MKVKKFGVISEVENRLVFSFFKFDAEGATPPFSSSDMIKAISDFILGCRMKHDFYDETGTGIECSNVEVIDCHYNSQSNEWDGEGLPPVGCEFLFGTHHTKAKCIAVGRDVIFASTGNPDEKDGFYEEFVISIHHSKFRPIRSEADKKRAEGVIALSRIDPNVAPFEYGDKLSDGSLIGSAWYELYDAIAAGKIPHNRID
ncbi:hypothetical protein ACCY75_01270 [Enterobacter kobei]|uniref:hypothetical protein n=1 Tax=Enterobacter kobei TaxID=208224 RepID=UPI003EDB657E